MRSIILLSAIILSSCSQREEVTTQRNDVHKGRMKGYAIAPLPSVTPAGIVITPQKVSFDITIDDETLSREEALKTVKTGLDRAEVEQMIQDGLKAVTTAGMSALPGGNLANELLGWGAAAVSALLAAGAGTKAIKNGQAVADAVALGSEALAELPTQKAEALKDKHRAIQKRRGTNETIKARL
jgi:hypothetical protein